MNYLKIILDVLLINISVLTTILFTFICVEQCWRTDKWRSNKHKHKISNNLKKSL